MGVLSVSSQDHRTGSSLTTGQLSSSVMPLYKVIELGPFGCRIERQSTKSLENIPKGYQVMDVSYEKWTIYIEPRVRTRP